MHKNATKCNKTLSKWCKNKHGASKIIDMFETYHTTKLESPWEGPYLIYEVIPGGAYRLRNPKTGADEKNPWNTTQLRRFYP
jgi:hypothetical protein